MLLSGQHTCDSEHNLISTFLGSPQLLRVLPWGLESQAALHLPDDKSCIPDVQYYLCALAL